MSHDHGHDHHTPPQIPAGPNVNVVLGRGLTGDQRDIPSDPRNAKDASPWVGSDRVVDDGSKPDRLTKSSFNSDKAFQESFTRVPSPNASAHYRYSDRDRDTPMESIPISQERKIANFVIEYLRRSEIEHGLSAEKLERGLAHGVGSAEEADFDDMLSYIATRVHTVASIDRGAGPGMKDETDSVIPIAVQQRVQITPKNGSERRFANRTAWLDLDTIGHGKSVAERTRGVREPAHPRLKRDRKTQRQFDKTDQKHDEALHHMHEGAKKMSKLTTKGATRLQSAAERLASLAPDTAENRPAKPDAIHLAEGMTPADALGLVDGKFYVWMKQGAIAKNWSVSHLGHEYVDGEGWVETAYITNGEGNTHPVRADALKQWNKDVIFKNILQEGFTYNDIVGPDEPHLDHDLSNNPSAVRYAETLQNILLTKESAQLAEAQLAVREKFDKLSMLLPETEKLSKYAASNSWGLWDIAKQETLKDVEYLGDDGDNYSGSPLIEKDADEHAKNQAKFIRDVIAWRHFGWELHLKYAIRGEDSAWIDSALTDETKALLHKLGDTEHSLQLRSSEYADLGRAIEKDLLTYRLNSPPDPSSKSAIELPSPIPTRKPEAVTPSATRIEASSTDDEKLQAMSGSLRFIIGTDDNATEVTGASILRRGTVGGIDTYLLEYKDTSGNKLQAKVPAEVLKKRNLSPPPQPPSTTSW